MTKVRVCIMAAFFGFTQIAVTAAAESFAESISDCRRINNKERRYQCYDEAESATSGASREVGDFSYKSTSDPITGQTLHTLSIRSSRGLNSRGEPIVLELRCDSTQPGEYDLRLRWGNFLASSTPEVTTRLGGEPSVSGNWQTDRRRETSIFPGKESGYTADAFINTLVEQVEEGNTNVVFRTQPYNAEPITAVFNFRGFVKVVEPMRQSCKF